MGVLESLKLENFRILISLGALFVNRIINIARIYLSQSDRFDIREKEFIQISFAPFLFLEFDPSSG